MVAKHQLRYDSNGKTMRTPNWPTPYVAPTLVVDSVVFQLEQNRLMVLLVKRGVEPFLGWHALPGGYCPAGETTLQAMTRILETKTSVKMADMNLVEQLYTFDTVARDPRGHAVSIAYMALGRDIALHETEMTQWPAFFPVDDLPELPYDHADIIKYAHERLRSKLSYTNAVFALLPKRFTLTHLQHAYEAILGHSLDKRNFRKKFLSLDLIQETDEMHTAGAHRPARLYEFRQHSLQTLDRSFD